MIAPAWNGPYLLFLVLTVWSNFSFLREVFTVPLDRFCHYILLSLEEPNSSTRNSFLLYILPQRRLPAHPCSMLPQAPHQQNGASQLSINRWMDNINAVHRYNGFCFVIKKNETCRKTDGPGNYYVKQTKKTNVVCSLPRVDASFQFFYMRAYWE